MRYAVVLAGGSGVRLWPMSRKRRPKQLIPFLDGKTLLEAALERLEGLLPQDQTLICAAAEHREACRNILSARPGVKFLGEPLGRDTLAAIGISAAVVDRLDPDATLAIFTADHIIEPREEFQRTVKAGFAFVEQHPETLLTFGIQPDRPATGYGYLELGELIEADVRRVRRFHEKPAAPVAEQYLAAGPTCYLWNSGMFVWKASTLLGCVRRYEPEVFSALERIASEWGTGDFEAKLAAEYPGLKKISVDYAVMEPASRDPQVVVAAIPMNLRWLDVGSWEAYAKARPAAEDGNVASGVRAVFQDSKGNLVVGSDADHLVAVLGCENMVIIHTPDATLVCPASLAEEVKKLHQKIGQEAGEEFL